MLDPNLVWSSSLSWKLGSRPGGLISRLPVVIIATVNSRHCVTLLACNDFASVVIMLLAWYSNLQALLFDLICAKTVVFDCCDAFAGA